MAVGGSADHRGVISTCNYKARQYGIHSAMASAHAMKLCPDLVIVPHRMEKYREAAMVMREIFHRYTDLVEPLSLDEAYLDVSESIACDGSATRIAEEIRRKVHEKLKITVSAGVSNSKFLAKVASDWQKPNGLFVITPAQVDRFVQQLPVSKIHGVGKVTASKMDQLGIHTCLDLRQYGLLELSKLFGSFGTKLYDLARGIDHREVKTSRVRKSLSVEHTYPVDLPDSVACQKQIPILLDELRTRLQRLGGRFSVSKAFVKVKFSDFSTTTLERAGSGQDLVDYEQLMIEAVSRKAKRVRLLGIGVRFAGLEAANFQLDLFDHA